MNVSAPAVLELLRRYESRNITFIDPDGTWPIVWERAAGVHVWDVSGRRYLDLTGAFGVAAAGHANPQVVRAGQAQMSRLLHAMGDVHPHSLKANLARELSRITFERWVVSKARPERADTDSRVRSARIWGKTIFCNSGFEAVEAALKTAVRATGKRGVIAFEGAYHGVGYGALNVTHRQYFRAAFRNQLAGFGSFLPFPGLVADLKQLETSLRRLTDSGRFGAIVVEPVQARGGINIPPHGFLSLLRRVCDQAGMLLICDEIYTGFGRTGRWFACEHSGTIPDLICLGKALTGGFPLSACVGRSDVMDAAWPLSNGEAIHTSTYLGHPVGCAMALAQIGELERLDLCRKSAESGAFLLRELKCLEAKSPLRTRVRGLGLMVGIELQFANRRPATATCLRILKGMLQAGFILLPEGENSNVISFTPPLLIAKSQLVRTVTALQRVLRASHA